MNSKLFGSLVAGMLLSSPSFAGDAKKTDAKADAAGWCKSNECGGHVKAKDGTAAKNSCKGQMACKGITKEDCEKGKTGTWTTEAKPKK